MKALENSLAPGTMLSVGESPPFGSNKRSPKKKTLQRNLDLKMRKGASGNGRTIGLEFDAFRLFNAIINHIIDLTRTSTQDSRLYTIIRFKSRCSTVRKSCAQERQFPEGWLAEPHWVGAVRRPLAHVAFLHS